MTFKNDIYSEGVTSDQGMGDNRLKTLYNSAPQVQPFEKEDDKMSWVRISLEDLSSVSTLSHQWCTQPFVTFSFYKYNEIILGKEKGLEKYTIGIPDIYHPERKNILQSDTKVEKFVCRSCVMPTIGEYGYWLINL